MSSPSPSEPPSILDGPYYTSRKAWTAARWEALTALEKVKMAVTKTKDVRAGQVNAGIDRIVRRIPDAGSVLEALADAEETGVDAVALKEHARKTAQLASYHLRADRLIAMVRENPFLPVDIYKIFAPALQAMRREIK